MDILINRADDSEDFQSRRLGVSDKNRTSVQADRGSVESNEINRSNGMEIRSCGIRAMDRRMAEGMHALVRRGVKPHERIQPQKPPFGDLRDAALNSRLGKPQRPAGQHLDWSRCLHAGTIAQFAG